MGLRQDVTGADDRRARVADDMTTFITREELRSALDSVTVVDALPPAPFGQRHLPGALNVVAEDSDERVGEALPDRSAAIVTYSTDASCTRGPTLAARLEALGYTHVRTYREGIEDWVGAGLPVDRPKAVTLDLADLALNATAWLFEGHSRAGVDVSMFMVRTPPGRAVELHVHPYAETFLLLEGRGRWTSGDEVVELEPEQMLVVPPDTPHGFRNIGDVPLLVVSMHERGTLRQTWLGKEPA
jgi:mannose-6-phosphate isomerase-like protein (cupin superfamily)/rhodanese-related sulfurtransferase